MASWFCGRIDLNILYRHEIVAGGEYLGSESTHISQRQSQTWISPYSHSIVNEQFFRPDINCLAVGVCGNTMKNTMLRNRCQSQLMRNFHR